MSCHFFSSTRSRYTFPPYAFFPPHPIPISPSQDSRKGANDTNPFFSVVLVTPPSEQEIAIPRSPPSSFWVDSDKSDPLIVLPFENASHGALSRPHSLLSHNLLWREECEIKSGNDITGILSPPKY